MSEYVYDGVVVLLSWCGAGDVVLFLCFMLSPLPSFSSYALLFPCSLTLRVFASLFSLLSVLFSLVDRFSGSFPTLSSLLHPAPQTPHHTTPPPCSPPSTHTRTHTCLIACNRCAQHERVHTYVYTDLLVNRLTRSMLRLQLGHRFCDTWLRHKW